MFCAFCVWRLLCSISPVFLFGYLECFWSQAMLQEAACCDPGFTAFFLLSHEQHSIHPFEGPVTPIPRSQQECMTDLTFHPAQHASQPFWGYDIFAYDRPSKLCTFWTHIPRPASETPHDLCLLQQHVPRPISFALQIRGVAKHEPLWAWMPMRIARNSLSELEELALVCVQRTNVQISYRPRS